MSEIDIDDARVYLKERVNENGVSTGLLADNRALRHINNLLIENQKQQTTINTLHDLTERVLDKEGDIGLDESWFDDAIKALEYHEWIDV